MAGVLAKILERPKMCDMDPRHGQSVVANLPGGRKVRLCGECARKLGHRVN